MGWAVDHVERLAGMILCNTGIAVPEGRSAPAIIRLAASAPMLELVCHGTPTFVEGTIRLSGDRLSAADRCGVPGAVQGGAGARGDRRLRRRHPAPSGPSVRARRSPTSPIGSARSPSRCCWRGGRATRCSTTTSPPTSRRDCRTPCCTASPNANHLVMAETGAGETQRRRRRRPLHAAVIANPSHSTDQSTRLRQDFGARRPNPDANGSGRGDGCEFTGDLWGGGARASRRRRGGVRRHGDRRRVALRRTRPADRRDRRRPAPPRTASRAIGWPCSRRRASTSSPPSTACGAPAGSRWSPIVGSACAASARRSGRAAALGDRSATGAARGADVPLGAAGDRRRRRGVWSARGAGRNSSLRR